VRRSAAAALLLALAATAAHAGALSRQFCGHAGAERGAAEHDRLLRFAEAARRELNASGARIALVARSGIDLERFAIRHTHAGLSLRASANAPWSVRQLYYACDAGQPRLFDQGLAGFVLGADDAQSGHLSLVLLPDEAAHALERAALDSPRALALVAGAYSANAYAFSTRYQNCNQWVAELMAAAWGEGVATRETAQAWLARHGYAPARVDLGAPWWRAAAAFVPWLNFDDQPAEREALTVLTSLPASLDAFVRQHWPGTRRIELCHDSRRIVVREGWTPIERGCVEREGDRVTAFDDAG
jgi:hypothetical protein